MGLIDLSVCHHTALIELSGFDDDDDNDDDDDDDTRKIKEDVNMGGRNWAEDDQDTQDMCVKLSKNK